MAPNLPPLLCQPSSKRSQRLCGVCKASGHDRRNCPHRGPLPVAAVVQTADENPNGDTAVVVPPPVTQPSPQKSPTINWEECMYVLFDLETTGGSRNDDDIIEIAAMVVGPDSIMPPN